MEVILLTSLFSVVFAVLFLSLFLRDRQVREFGGVEREALLPLDDGDEGFLRRDDPQDPGGESPESGARRDGKKIFRRE